MDISDKAPKGSRWLKKSLPQIKKARIVFLTGELGSGKTYFVKHLAKALGIKQEITSPSFQIVKVYPIPCSPRKLIHIDLYRLKKISGWQEIPELKDYFSDNDNLIMIEWGEKLARLIKPDLVIKFNNDRTFN